MNAFCVFGLERLAIGSWEHSQPGYAHSERPSLPLTHFDFCAFHIGHDKNKAAARIRADFFHSLQIDERRAAGTKETARSEGPLQLRKLIVDPVGIILDPNANDSAVHIKKERLRGIQQKYSICFPGNDLFHWRKIFAQQAADFLLVVFTRGVGVQEFPDTFDHLLEMIFLYRFEQIGDRARSKCLQRVFMEPLERPFKTSNPFSPGI
jgi:hypothetical protein